ncbi:MAG TPA: NAD-dependent epimerase/dehydratase family protein, partial [Chitinophagaceae bacterium]
MSTILITGGTGMIGTALQKELSNKGHDIIVLTRYPGKYSNTSRVSYARWDVKNQQIDTNAILKADHIIHLAGAGVADKRWTSKRKREIVESRTLSSALLVKALSENINHVKTIVSASAIGWYGPAGNFSKAFGESDPAADDFLGTTCKQWEASIDPVVSLG